MLPLSSDIRNPCMTESTCAIEYQGGIVAIDSGLLRECMAACYLLEAEGQSAIIETGTNASVPHILRVLERRGWDRDAVRYVIATHVHLDHAGGAGRLMQELPQAEFLVHPRGARHMIDPARLEASVRLVYGDETYDETYGQLQPIDADRVREMADGDTVSVGGRELLFRDSPGHARHHFCVWDAHSRGWFTGDTFGLSYRELDTAKGPFIFPTTTPVQFDPAALRRSVDMLMEAGPDWMYLTHFGRVGDVERLAEDLLKGVDVLVELAERHTDADARTEAIQDDMLQWLRQAAREHDVQLPDAALDEILLPDIVLNTQGIEFWLDHR